MDVKIMGDHPPEIQELVRNVGLKLYGKDFHYDENSSAGSLLVWDRTPQGAMFWKYINDGLYDKAKEYKCYPKPKNTIVNEYQIF